MLAEHALEITQAAKFKLRSSGRISTQERRVDGVLMTLMLVSQISLTMIPTISMPTTTHLLWMYPKKWHSWHSIGHGTKSLDRIHPWAPLSSTRTLLSEAISSATPSKETKQRKAMQQCSHNKMSRVALKQSSLQSLSTKSTPWSPAQQSDTAPSRYGTTQPCRTWKWRWRSTSRRMQTSTKRLPNWRSRLRPPRKSMRSPLKYLIMIWSEVL